MYLSNCKDIDHLIIQYLNNQDKFLISSISKVHFELVTKKKLISLDFDSIYHFKDFIGCECDKQTFKHAVQDIINNKFNLVQCIYNYFIFPDDIFKDSSEKDLE